MKDLRVLLAQSELRWAQAAANQADFEELLAQEEREFDVVVLPESWATGFAVEQLDQVAEPHNLHSFKWMVQQASRFNALVIGSLFTRVGQDIHNRCYAVAPDGKYAAYDKAHLSPFGGEGENATAGSERVEVQWRGWRLRLCICYDLRFPVWLRTDRPPYDALVCVANWPSARQSTWNTLLSARAQENQAFSIGVNRVGVDENGFDYAGGSQIVSPLGERLAECANETGTTLATLSVNHLKEIRQNFPFLHHADPYTLPREAPGGLRLIDLGA